MTLRQFEVFWAEAAIRDLEEIKAYRELILPPYRLMYRVEPRRVLVVAVFDGRRDLGDVLVARLVRP